MPHPSCIIEDMDNTPPQGMRSPTVDFAVAARRLGAATRRLGCVAPSFRTPPRLVGLDRTLRRHGRGAVVAVRVKGRPWAAVLADMVDGVVAVNAVAPVAASRLRADLWESVGDLVATRDGPGVTDRPTSPQSAPRADRRQVA